MAGLSVPLLDAGRGLRVCVFALSDRSFAVDLCCVKAVRPCEGHTKVPRGPAHLIGMINVHGSIVPLLNSRALLGLSREDPGPPTQAVVLAWESMQVAITVDQVLGLEVLDADASSGPEAPSSSPFASGLRRRADGWIELLDVSRIVRSLAPGAVTGAAGTSVIETALRL